MRQAEERTRFYDNTSQRPSSGAAQSKDVQPRVCSGFRNPVEACSAVTCRPRTRIDVDPDPMAIWTRNKTITNPAERETCQSFWSTFFEQLKTGSGIVTDQIRPIDVQLGPPYTLVSHIARQSSLPLFLARAFRPPSPSPLRPFANESNRQGDESIQRELDSHVHAQADPPHSFTPHQTFNIGARRDALQVRIDA